MIAFFDCFSGISGNMILGALVDAGLNPDLLKKEIKKLKLSGYSIRIRKVSRGHLSGKHIEVITKDNKRRKLKDIIGFIEKSKLSRDIKAKSIEVFNRLADAEARVHRVPKKDLHFHEVGDLDSIIDIVGAVIGLKLLGVKEVYASRIHMGNGFVKCRSGILPVPAPATLELLKGVPVYGGDVNNEIVTPTGAAIISTYSKGFGDMPSMKIKYIGYGAGSRKLNIPNMLRLIIGEHAKAYDEDRVNVIETNIDDMNPQIYDYLFEQLFAAGAIDVFLTPVQMKKNRPATMLTVLADNKKTDDITSIIFKETTTFGVRIHEVKRKKLFRKIETIQTRYGKVRVKTGSIGKGIVTVTPEYEDCKSIAKKSKVSIKTVYDEVRKISGN